MRTARLLGSLLTILTAGLLLAPPAGAQPPSRLTDHITDNTTALTDAERTAVNSAIDRLYQDRHIQLWVVYVDNFSRFKPENWADRTRTATGLGDHDALLAVATNTKTYVFSPPPKAQGLTAAALSSLRTGQIEPAVGAKDWSGAAVAAADGLNKATTSPPTRAWLPIVIGVLAVVLAIVLVLMLYRARRRRARRAGPRGGLPNIEGRDDQLAQALSTAETRLRQVSDYVAKHRENVGAQAQARLEETRRYVAAAHGKEATSVPEAIAYANGASKLAAEAQTLANADVLAAHNGRRRGGNASAR